MGEHPNPRVPQAASLPRWARVADGLAVAVCGLAGLVAIFGGFRLHLPGARLSITSAPRVLALAAVIVLIRHAMLRQAPVFRRAWNALARVWLVNDVRAVFTMWVMSRFAVLVVGFLAIGSFGYSNNATPFRLFKNEILNLPARYDAGWYLGIAVNGYHWDPAVSGQQNIAFMPALPMLMRVGGRLLGGQSLWAGQFLVLLASLWGFVYVYRLARASLGDAERATTAVALLAAYPFAVFYSAVYTESIFLLCSAGAFYHLTRREYGRTAAFALLCGFARPNGFLLAIPLALVAIWPALVDAWADRSAGLGGRIRGALRESSSTVVAASAAVVGVLVFSAFIYAMTGRPFAWLEAHAAWGRTFGTWVSRGPFQELQYGGLYGYTRSQPIDAVNFLAAIGFVAAIWPVTRRFGVAYGAFVAVNLLPPLAAGGLLSIGRVTAPMFPVFIWLACVIPARQRAAWLILFAMLQGWGAALFFTWRGFT